MTEKPKDEVAELRAHMERMSRELEAIARRNRELEVAATGAVLPPDDQPAYEIINCASGYFSPDCIFYPEGARFVDVTGSITPCEAFLPLNRPAEARMDAWLRSLPSQTRTPPIDLILESAMKLRPQEGGAEMDRTEFFAAVMHDAIEAARKGGRSLPINQPITRPVKMDGVPLMTNSRLDGRLAAPSAPATRYLGEGPAPADKREPPVTSRAELLGRNAPPRVTVR